MPRLRNTLTGSIILVDDELAERLLSGSEAYLSGSWVDTETEPEPSVPDAGDPAKSEVETKPSAPGDGDPADAGDQTQAEPSVPDAGTAGDGEADTGPAGDGEAEVELSPKTSEETVKVPEPAPAAKPQKAATTPRRTPRPRTRK